MVFCYFWAHRCVCFFGHIAVFFGHIIFFSSTSLFFCLFFGTSLCVFRAHHCVFFLGTSLCFKDQSCLECHLLGSVKILRSIWQNFFFSNNGNLKKRLQLFFLQEIRSDWHQIRKIHEIFYQNVMLVKLQKYDSVSIKILQGHPSPTSLKGVFLRGYNFKPSSQANVFFSLLIIILVDQCEYIYIICIKVFCFQIKIVSFPSLNC